MERESFTWGYALTDLSAGNIAALLADPAVEDTHHINQAALRVDVLAERMPTENEEEIGELLLAGCLCLFGRYELRRASDVSFDLAVTKMQDAVGERSNLGFVRDDKDRVARLVEPIEKRHDLGARL